MVLRGCTTYICTREKQDDEFRSYLGVTVYSAHKSMDIHTHMRTHISTRNANQGVTGRVVIVVYSRSQHCEPRSEGQHVPYPYHCACGPLDRAAVAHWRGLADGRAAAG